MAQTPEPKVEELKQLLRRLERIGPQQAGDALPAAIPSQPDGVQHAPAGDRGKAAEKKLPFAQTGLGAVVIAAAVSALLSTGISVMVIRGMRAPQPPGIAGAVQPQEDRRDSASAPPSQAALVEPMPIVPPASTEARATRSEPSPANSPAENIEQKTAETAPVRALSAEPEAAIEAPVPASQSTLAAISSAPVAPDAAQFLQRAQLMLSSGNIGAARVLLERAVELGSGEAALVLGSTYDAARSRELGIAWSTPNSGLARRWYERAAMLGAEDARQRLRDLDKGGS